MATCNEIQTVESMTTNCCVCECSGFLMNPDNDVRIKKSSIMSYRPIDVLPDYQIEFMLDNGMIQIWTFTTATARDDALAAIDNVLGVTTVP